MITTVAEMRAKRARGIEFTLPEYGDVVWMRPMDAEFFYKSGRIPDFLASTVEDMIKGSQYQMVVPENKTPDETTKWLAWLDELVKWTIISPKVVDDPQADDEIGVDEIGYADKIAIYSWFGRPAQALRFFRDQQAKPVGFVDAPKDNGNLAEQSAERPAERLALVGAA